MRYLRKNNGITLIALVITIIVLLILAGIAIAMLSGENGILTKVKDAKINQEQEEKLEKIKLAVTASMTNQEHKVDKEVLENELKKYFDEVNVSEEAPYTVGIEGESYIIQSNGDIAKSDSGNEENDEEDNEEILSETSDSGKVTVVSNGADLCDYKIYGKSVQDETPSSDTPIEVESVGDKTVNLFDISLVPNTKNITNNQDGTLTIVADENTGGYCNTNTKLSTLCPDLKVGDVCVLSGKTNGINAYNNPTTYIRLSIPKESWRFGDEYVRTITQDDLDSTIVVYGSNDASETKMSDIQIQRGTTVTPYEPYGYKIPVKARGKNLLDMNKWFNIWSSYDSNNITSLSYQGRNCYLVNMSTFYATDYVVEGIKENTQYTLSADFISNTGNVGFRIYYTDGTRSDMYYINATSWTRFSITSTANKTIQSIRGCGASGGNVYVSNIQLEENTQVTDYEPYIEPVTTNIYLNEPLRKIGDYADCIDFKNKKVVRNIGVETTGFKQYSFDSATKYLYLRNSPYFSDMVSNSLDCISNKIATFKSFPGSADNNALMVDGKYFFYFVVAEESEIQTYIDLLKDVTIYYPLSTSDDTETIDLPNIPTHKGTNIIEIDTKISPSKIQVTYKK